MERKRKVNSKEYILEQFLAEKKAQGVSELTLEGYSKDIYNLLANVESVPECTQEFLSAYINNMLKVKKPVTVNHYIRCYRVFLYWCMDNKYLEHYKIKTVRCQEAPIKIYSQEDIEKLLKKPSNTDSFGTWRSWAIISFALGTGARAGTIVNIKIEDIDLEHHEVVYRHSKNKRAPIIPLCDNLLKVLSLYLNEFNISDYLFPNTDNTNMNIKALYTSIKRYCEKRNVVFKSFHAFRHTYAREFIINGGNPFQLQRILDHQSLSMSNHYAHLFATDLRDAINDYSPLSKMSGKVERR